MGYVVLTGGGTGGHVFPGLAVAEELTGFPDLDLVWLGSPKGIEAQLVGEAHIPNLTFQGIPAGKLRRYVSFSNIVDIFRILGGFFVCLLFFLKRRPQAVFSKGGYVTVPPVWAAGVLGIPVFSHESDFDPGLATRLNLRWTKTLFVAYQETLDQIGVNDRREVLVSGNPIRKAIFQGDKNELVKYFLGFNFSVPVIVVLGGSLGAVQLNELVQGVLSGLRGKAIVIHQHGNNWVPPKEEPGFYYPRQFLGPEIAHVLAGADIALARAGAGTLWELAAWKIPGILIPLTAGSRGDQIRNAGYFSELGACLTLVDPEQSVFSAQVLDLVNDVKKREILSRGYSQLPTTAAQVIAVKIQGVLT